MNLAPGMSPSSRVHFSPSVFVWCRWSDQPCRYPSANAHPSSSVAQMKPQVYPLPGGQLRARSFPPGPVYRTQASMVHSRVQVRSSSLSLFAGPTRRWAFCRSKRAVDPKPGRLPQSAFL